jgi:hypothetical protein
MNMSVWDAFISQFILDDYAEEGNLLDTAAFLEILDERERYFSPDLADRAQQIELNMKVRTGMRHLG